MCKNHGCIDEHVENVITYGSNSSQYVKNQAYNGSAQYRG